MIENHFSGYKIEFGLGDWGEEPESNEVRITAFGDVIELLQRALTSVWSGNFDPWVFPFDHFAINAYFMHKPVMWGDKELITITYQDETIVKPVKLETCHDSDPDDAHIACLTKSGKLYSYIDGDPGILGIGFDIKELIHGQEIKGRIRQALQDGIDELTKPCSPRPF